MTNYSQAPTGLGRRGRRLSDHDTQQRVLGAAVAMVNRTGLTVSLDHISFEDIIRDADVSRSAVYRRWPYKDLFFSDLVKELAKAAIPTTADNEAITGLIRRVVDERPGWLNTPELRHSLVVELLRQAALLDFETLYRSAEWRTYIALHATFMSLADGELRDQVQATLAQSEVGFIARVAQAWQQIAGLFGYRLRPELGASFETLATLVSATARGLIIMALSMPELVAHRAQARPSGAAAEAEWSLPAMGMAAIASAFLEADPSVDWDDERLATVGQALSTLAVPNG
jgi:AcrR family transcriptional regulator